MYTLVRRDYYTRNYDSWWELISEVKRNSLDSHIAHNENDIFTYPTWTYGEYLPNMRYEPRKCFIYKDGTLVNLAEIRAALIDFVEKPRFVCYTNYRYRFEFRREPVPFTGGHGRRRGYHRHIKHFNKSYLLTLKSFGFSDSRLSNELGNFLVCQYDDWDYPRDDIRSWKHQSKKRHQWE
jgi:hypothetical protein